MRVARGLENKMTSARGIVKQKGVGLIEVMVTVLILSTSLLALAALQNRSLQYNHEAYLRSQANILAYDLMDRIRLNLGQLGNYALGLDDDPPVGTSRAATDMREWRQRLAAALPDGAGGVACNGATRVCVVNLRWLEANGTDPGNDSTTTTFTYQTRL
jgi:type IV pilus assembly protein PilV